jgi:hypothetical protein
MKCSRKLISVAVLTVAGYSLSATELYNLGFDANDFGTYQIVSGNPSIQASVEPFTNALIFHAVTGSDKIKLPISAGGSRYNIQFDVLVHNVSNSQYAFFMAPETARQPYVYFHGGATSILAFQSWPYTNAVLALFFAEDQKYHFDISFDLQNNIWAVAIDGTHVFECPVNSPSLDGMSFSMGPWYMNAPDAPATYAALDNVVVSMEAGPQLSISVLDDHQLQISWPTNAIGYLLECATNAALPLWSSTTNTVTNSVGRFSVMIDAGFEFQIFRLHKP